MWTIGHGITYLTEDESLAIVAERVGNKHLGLLDQLDWYGDLPANVQGVILEMCFQIGTSGMLKFKKMIANICNTSQVTVSKTYKIMKVYKKYLLPI